MNKFVLKYGNPFRSDGTVDTAWQNKFEPLWMRILKYPAEIKKAFPTLGETVYINKDFEGLYLKFLYHLIERNLQHEVTVNDQCFMIRLIRGSTNSPSIHSWGMAVDLNPVNNPLGLSRDQANAKGLHPFTPEFQDVAKSCGIVCGYDFKRIDGMHFEHSNW